MSLLAITAFQNCGPYATIYQPWSNEFEIYLYELWWVFADKYQSMPAHKLVLCNRRLFISLVVLLWVWNFDRLQRQPTPLLMFFRAFNLMMNILKHSVQSRSTRPGYHVSFCWSQNQIYLCTRPFITPQKSNIYATLQIKAFCHEYWSGDDLYAETRDRKPCLRMYLLMVRVETSVMLSFVISADAAVLCLFFPSW